MIKFARCSFCGRSFTHVECMAFKARKLFCLDCGRGLREPLWFTIVSAGAGLLGVTFLGAAIAGGYWLFAWNFEGYPRVQFAVLVATLFVAALVSFGIYWSGRFCARWLTFFEVADAHPHCLKCGYDLTGIAAPACPECGESPPPKYAQGPIGGDDR